MSDKEIQMLCLLTKAHINIRQEVTLTCKQACKEAYDAVRDKQINKLRKAHIYMGNLIRIIKNQEYSKSNIKKKDINKAVVTLD